MIEEDNDIPIGIVISMSLYAIYAYATNKLLQIFSYYDIDNWIIFMIYFVPFVILYIETPIIIKKSNGWRRYLD